MLDLILDSTSVKKIMDRILDSTNVREMLDRNLHGHYKLREMLEHILDSTVLM